MTRFDAKIARIRAGNYKRTDFIIADAKDGDMGPSIPSCGPKLEKDCSHTRYRTRAEFLSQVKSVIAQDVVDIMLTSASNLELLVESGAYAASNVKPAIRANDTTDIWVVRGATYSKQPSRPFRSASLSRVKKYTDLGLYSITFNNDLDQDYSALEHFSAFREDAARNKFKYFLEVFNPNVECGIDPAMVPHYINDCIVRCLAGVTKADRPQFLKIAYNGPKALEELASFDPSITVGVLGGGAGTTRDCFELLNQAEKYGARVALFGRKINLAEDPLAMVSFMHEVASGNIQPLEAVKAYHGSLQKNGLKAIRELAADSEITEKVLKAG
jgi:DhnA family fructose-bisphosphate aldolase class Ia